MYKNICKLISVSPRQLIENSYYFRPNQSNISRSHIAAQWVRCTRNSQLPKYTITL